MNQKKIHFSPKKYQQLADRLSPDSKTLQMLLRSFWVGGVICVLGQGLTDIGALLLKLPPLAAGSFASIVLVFCTAVLTGIGLFDKIGQYAGAGSFVPITGFANAMVAPALEFRREGLVLGLGAKLFTIAGPVLVYGVGASVLVGILYAIFRW